MFSLECPLSFDSKAGLPESMNASAPLVTKLENLLIDLPPSRLWNGPRHSPVFWMMSLDGEELLRGVIDPSSASSDVNVNYKFVLAFEVI